MTITNPHILLMSFGIAVFLVCAGVRLLRQDGEPETQEEFGRVLESLPCPWCEGPMRYYRLGFHHAAICEDDDCGFASKTATLAAMANDIVAQRGCAPNA